MVANPNHYKLMAAKELMQADQYDAARAVLETIPFDQTAQQWLKWMDDNPTKQKRKTLGKGMGWARVLPLVFACSLCSFIAGFGAARNPTTNSVQVTQTRVAAGVPTNATRSTSTSFPTDESEEQAVVIPTIEPTDQPIILLTDEPVQPAQVAVETITFDSETEGLQAVIGPVAIPSGAYQVTATTDGFISVSVEVIEGECTLISFGPSLFNLTQGQATDGAETLFASDGCRALIEVSNTREPWTIEFGALEPVPADVPLSFNSEDEGLQAVIGPVSIPSGTYQVSVTTDGFIGVRVGAVSGTCNVGFGESLFNLTQGQASDGAEAIVRSTDCIALIVVGNTREPWILEFESLE